MILETTRLLARRRSWFYPIARQVVRLGILGKALPTKNRGFQLKTGLIFRSFLNLPTSMPHKRVSDDIDHVPIDPKPSKIPRKNPPPPPPPPTHAPILISNPLHHGHSQIPEEIAPDDAYSIFCLFFSDDVLSTIRDNTNQYAEFHSSSADKQYARKWNSTTIPELKAYIGVHIWMGLHPETARKDFWNTDPDKGPLHDRVRQAISLKRWEQIDRFLHISSPQNPTQSSQKETPFSKLEPLNDTLRQLFKQYWKIGTHLAVDETIQRFMGRASEIVNIPSKPTPEGFKIWVLANLGYILDWLYHAKGDHLGPVDLDDFWTDNLRFSKTQSVVLDLVTQQGINNNFQHIIWLDNLFTSARLLRQLKQEGFGAAGTVRTQKTAREKIEEKDGSTQQQKALLKEQNRGLNPLLSSLKLEYNAQIPWGQLYLISDREVLQAAWKDQNVVFFMSTVSTGMETILRPRRRPTKSATNARTSREVFGDLAIKELLIPKFIDDYNHYMGGVDHADQLRSYYNTQRIHLKNWKPLWHFLLDTTITNCFKLHRHHLKTPARRYGQKEFRTKLAVELFNHSEHTTTRPGRPAPIKTEPLSHYVIPDSASEHQHLVLSQKSRPCIVCKTAGRTAERVMVRKPLGKVSHNARRPDQKGKKRRLEQKKTRYGCRLCNQFICRVGSCWEEHIEAIQ